MLLGITLSQNYILHNVKDQIQKENKLRWTQNWNMEKWKFWNKIYYASLINLTWDEPNKQDHRNTNMSKLQSKRKSKPHRQKYGIISSSTTPKRSIRWPKNSQPNCPCKMEMFATLNKMEGSIHICISKATKTCETINFVAHCCWTCDMACIYGPLQHSSFSFSQ